MLPNDSFLQQPGASGTALATHAVGGKEYPVVMRAGPSGHILDSLETWIGYADAVAYAANKQMISLLNASGSGKIVKVRKLFLVNLALAAVTGVAVRLDVKRITAHSAGTVITPQAMDSQNAVLPVGITLRTGSTVTEGALLFPITMANDEVGATQAFPSSLLMQGFNWLFEHDATQDLVLREGEGLTVKNITSTTVGSLGIILLFTVE
jgi:hypothetical protein